MFTSRYYSKSPFRVQEAMISARGFVRSLLREGRSFREYLREVETTQWYKEGELSRYCNDTLANIVKHSLKNLTFYDEYRRLLPEFASKPATELLRQLPILDKDVIRSHGQEFLANKPRRLLITGATSGTTGTPLKLFQDLNAINRENAFIWRQLIWAGYFPGARRAWIRGDMIVPVAQKDPPFWRKNRSENMLMFSSYHLSEKNAPTYLEALTKYDPVILQAYPSSITFLAAYLASKGDFYRGRSLKGIVTSSEVFSESQRQLVEERFGCRVFDWYGQFERVAAIGTCEFGHYHVISDYSFVEFLPARDGMHEIVGTGFNNLSMPLIRYNTGDFVELSEQKECACGRAFPMVTQIHGRSSDYIKLRDGRRIARITMIFEELEGILEAQIVQDKLDEIIITIVPTSDFSVAVEREIVQKARQRLGNDIEVHINVVKEISRTNSGKLREVICNI